jgi:hypothetical protein
MPKNGRPPKLKKEMLEEARILCSLGLTEENLATYWGVSTRSVTRWKAKTPELCLAIERGRLNANISVMKALFENAKKTNNLSAQIFWLTNRCPDIWADKRAVINNNNNNYLINKGDNAPKDFTGEDQLHRERSRSWLKENDI